ncbi:MAG: ATP-binding cassette domain-containing protein [Planctomycetia bacterium]|nr:ATP-binding cassette domain-containing protein [Planctomycetia bacterium]
MAGVVLENLSRVYSGGVLAVNGVTLTVQDREFLVLVGPSGSGKTTTLRMIAGLEEVSSGKIAIGTRAVNDVPPKDRDIAMVFQNYALYPHMSVYKNLAFGLELREKTNGFGWLWRWALPTERRARLATRRFAIAERVHQAARVLGIEELLERYPRQLSGGERQRVALGRAIVRNPAVFLFDEPLSNLDAKLRVEMRRELKQLHQRLQTTIVYVTHDQVEALTLGDRIVVMNEGTIQQVGRPIEVYDWPSNRFVAGFIGTPAMNFIPGELISQRAGCEFRRADWLVPLAGRQIEPRVVQAMTVQSTTASRPSRAAVLGVRPEDVSIEKSSDNRSGTLQAVVSLVDMLGDSTVATLEVDDRSTQHQSETLYVLSKMEPRSDLRLGDRVSVQVNAQRVHLFDPETGESWMRKPVAN